ncbi:MULTISPECIES: sodium:solute symporter family protein [Acidiphilium]|uniref:Solute:Na+ symporter, SSS family n=1 Tax=Acidiphilium rubrum TaxID=526 RepID=A0A8G2FDF2_ACIRU|nr:MULTISPECIES: sodium:solute symporter [Acidiphilium]MBW4033901.1 sodium:solute symporter [Pseudomonadota bacterium]SIQ40761.1 solute:Na+ symporter, SSS family [Acidiphilium rubrum]
MTIALILLGLTAVFALLLGIGARSGHTMGLEEWTVGNRGFGFVLVFLLLAGEIYTTFTFLGASGFAYGQGAPAYYILAYGTIAYVLGYFMLPKVWTYAKQHHLVSQPDFFAHKYDSPALGIIVALVDIVALIPYLVLQLTGLGIIVVAAGYGGISNTVAVLIGAVVVTIYVISSGVRGSAWTAVAKDIMILSVVLFLGIYLPIHLYGGVGAMFTEIAKAKPGFLTFAPKGQSVWWFVSTVLLTALGFFMWPHSLASCYTAREAKVFRKNAMVLPIYQLILLFVYFVGFAAVLKIPALKGAASNLALFKLVVATLPPWAVGIVGAAGVLTALVPGSMITMTAATLTARNLYGAYNKNATDDQIVFLAKCLVPVVMAIAVFFTLTGNSTIVTLLLVGYSFVTQMFPALVASLFPNSGATRQGAMAGIVVGVGVAAWLTFSHASVGSLMPFLPQAIKDLNVGIIALIANIVVLAVVSAATRRSALLAAE